ncbi:hypothetical protein MTX26_04890 [Bradyrhizobium sp. ISRA443]|uniref:hypothetical protein n=1 Tax=unclassified Bradyrhizobium TaxID=2631580 RepID=UPI0024784FF1|nr:MULTISPECIES: hypothetical protein [unclassified Bradyrhizobium]WGS00194.1 hypothetical protein MTX23_04890 [Bradyrhizobium sp. ISRA436]WGS07083.1 hypothetical protein MTX18_04890 [Bradyrhizobium sp. ISRA437]WGS13966.1 hypothetical protein MTX26_04890 [Bradyrhizobium sp. ISRA443]
MPGSPNPVVALAFCAAALFIANPARAQNSDRTLLSTFCAAASIKGSTCTRARSYPNAAGRACDVTLTKERYAGRFLAAGSPLLVVNYESECEPHATDFGGVALFAQNGQTYRFVRFLPGAQGHDCIVLPGDERRDALVCALGHMGQGILESAVARMEFTSKAGKGIAISPDFLVRAEDTVSAYGSNVVTCNEGPKYFGLSNLAAGPRRNSVAVDVDYADDETIRTACGEGFPKPKELYHDLEAGEAFVPPGYEKKKRFTIDLVTRKAAPAD